MKWERIPLTEFIWFQRGFDLPKDSFVEGEFPVIGSTSVLGYHNEAKAKGPGIVTGRSGTLGQFQYIESDFLPHNTSLWVKDFYGNDVRFAYYLLHTLDLISLNGGGAVPSLNRNFLASIEVSIPPLPTQRKIAGILSAYDDLIENNLKRIKLLEEKAFLRYLEIVKSGEAKVVAKLGDIIQTIKRKNKIQKSMYKTSGSYPIIDQSTDFIGGYTDDKEAVYEDLPIIVFGDHTRILKYINFPFACGADGTQLVKPMNPEISVAYLYFELKSCNLSNYHYARHFKYLKEQEISLPSVHTLKGYAKETEYIFKYTHLLMKQNSKLREARDILLPKLMSGQIEV